MTGRTPDAREVGTPVPGEPTAPPRRRSRWGLYGPFLAVGLLALAWSAYWLLAARRVEAELDGALAREAAAGRTWTCPGRAVRGYPFRILVACEAPTFAGAGEGGAPVTGRLAAVRAVARAYAPTSAVLEADGPLVVEGPGGRLEANWRLAHASLRGGTAGLSDGRFEVEAPALSLRAPGIEPLVLIADRLEVALREDPALPGARDAYLKLAGAVLPPLDALLGTNEPVDLTLDALLTGPASPGGDARAAIEAWRLGGGRVELRALALAKGATRLEARGPLRLDDERRIAGRLDATVVGFDALLARFGGRTAAVGGIIGTLLGGGFKGAKPGEPAKAVTLPLVLEGGRASLGPFPLPVVLVPLY